MLYDTQCVLKMHFAITSKKRKLSDAFLVNAIPQTVHCYLNLTESFFFFVLLQLLSPSVRPQVKEDVSRRFLIILETFYDLFLNCHDNQAQKADEILSHCPINSFLEISFLSRDVLKKVK